MKLTVVVCLIIVVAAARTDADNPFLHDLFTAAEHETPLNEDLARLLGFDYERQASVCGADVTSRCCSSCDIFGSCYNGGVCCELSKVRTKMLKADESSCPESWQSDCKTTKMVPIESCNLGSAHRKNSRIEKPYYQRKSKVSDEYANDSSDSDEDRQVEKAGFRLMCVCLQTQRCCSNPIYAAYTTYASTAGPYLPTDFPFSAVP